MYIATIASTSVLQVVSVVSFFKKKACADFLAGSTLRSKSRYAALSETAIFGRACRHEFPKRFLNMKHGERYVFI